MFAPSDGEGLAEHLEDLRRNNRGVLHSLSLQAAHVIDQYDEFVSPQTRHRVRIAHAGL